MTKTNSISLVRKEERLFAAEQEVTAVLHRFTLNDQLTFSLIQDQRGLHIPRQQSGKGSYHFLQREFKDYLMTMIAQQQIQGTFPVAINYLQTHFQTPEKNEQLLAVGELNCYNLLKVPDVAIIQRGNQQLALQFTDNLRDEHGFEQSLAVRITSGYAAKTILNQFMLQEIQQKVDMKRVAEQYVQLKKTGRSYCGYSPFRSERTASFHVFPETNSWYDFGMNEGGDAVSFVRKKHEMGFSQAVHCLYEWSKTDDFQRKYPLPEQKHSKYTQEQLLDTIAMYQRLSTLEKQQWPKVVEQYCQQRKFRQETWNEFQLSWLNADLLAKLSQAPEDTLERFDACGLVHRGTNHWLHFKLNNRIAIPLHNEDGQVVGYNGRSLQAGAIQAKYLLTHNSAICQKSQLLFNYHRAKTVAQQKNCIVLCEGAFDVMRCHEVGIENSVALLGSSLSETQLALLKKLEVPIVLALDNDEAGKKATMKIKEQLAAAGVRHESYDFTKHKDLDELLLDANEVWQLKMTLAKQQPMRLDHDYQVSSGMQR